MFPFIIFVVVLIVLLIAVQIIGRLDEEHVSVAITIYCLVMAILMCEAAIHA